MPHLSKPNTLEQVKLVAVVDSLPEVQALIAQLADLQLRTDFLEIEVTLGGRTARPGDVSEIFKLLTQFEKEIKTIMPSINEVKTAVAAKAEEVKAAINTAVATETEQVTAQIKALKDQIAAGASVSVEDLDALLGSVGGIAPAVTSAVDAISSNDGA